MAGAGADELSQVGLVGGQVVEPVALALVVAAEVEDHQVGPAVAHLAQEAQAAARRRSRHAQVVDGHLHPESLVQQETQSVIYDIVRENTARGVRREQMEEKKHEIFDAAVRNASDRIRLRYILHRIAEEEGISVSAEELAAHIRSMAYRYGTEAASLRDQLAKRNALDNVREELRMDKTLDFLLEQADVKM